MSSSRLSSSRSGGNSREGPRAGTCYCGVPVEKLVSWTEKNPGRRFKKCKFDSGREDGLGCGYWRWIDNGILDWQRDVSNQLIAENRGLRLEVASLKEKLQELEESTEIQMKHKSSKCQMCGSVYKFFWVLIVVVGIVLLKMLG